MRAFLRMRDAQRKHGVQNVYLVILGDISWCHARPPSVVAGPQPSPGDAKAAFLGRLAKRLGVKVAKGHIVVIGFTAKNGPPNKKEFLRIQGEILSWLGFKPGTIEFIGHGTEAGPVFFQVVGVQGAAAFFSAIIANGGTVRVISCSVGRGSWAETLSKLMPGVTVWAGTGTLNDHLPSIIDPNRYIYVTGKWIGYRNGKKVGGRDPDGVEEK